MILPASAWLHAAAAVIILAWTLLALGAGRGRGAWLMAASGTVTAVWAVAVASAASTPFSGLAGAAEVLRSTVWLTVLVLLCGTAGGGLRWVGGLGLGLAALGLMALLPGVAEWLNLPALGAIDLLPRLGLSLLVVLAAENLYRNAPEATRWHVVLPAIGIGGLAAFDMLLLADAVLSRSFSPALTDARAVLAALAAPLLAIAALRDRRIRQPLPVSRAFVFHGATLMVAGTFLLAVGALSETLRRLGDPWSRTAQAALLGAAVLALLVAVSATSVRSRLRSLLAEHFFRARYDYRGEWLRCVGTLSGAGTNPELAAVRALADAVDSPAGALLLRDGAAWRWAGGWNAESAALPPPGDWVGALRDGGWVARDDEVPALRAALPRLWLVAPLVHPTEGLIGAVLLTRPRAPRTPDGELSDLLRMLGHEVAMFLAERQAARRLAEEAQLQVHAHRFAFVAHDVKTVASQLTLLLSNAEAHIANPEFQRDMLLTVRAAADRINALIARLRQPEPEAPAFTEPLARLRALAARLPHRIEIEGSSSGPIAMPPEHFDSAVTHLIDNAAQASGGPVRLLLAGRDGRAWLDITDQGPGMTAEFVRDGLFRPLVTARPGGSGVGAWQARELLRRSGGDLEVDTAPGRGTTMRLLLPGLPV